MPGDDGLGLEEQQGLLPVRPKAPQANPKQSVGGAEYGFASLAFEHSQLMPEGQVFEHKSGMGLAASEQATEKQQKELEHDDANFGRRCRKINVFGGLRDFRYPHDGGFHHPGKQQQLGRK